MPFSSRHVVSALALHVVLFTFLLVGVRCAPKVEQPAVIEAMVITGQNKAGKVKEEPPPAPKVEPPPEPPKPEPPPPPPPPEPPKPPPPKPPPPKPEPPKPNPEEVKRKAEAERVKREEILKQQAEIQRQKAEQDRIKKEAEEAKRKAAEEEKRRKEEEQRKIAEEKRRKEEEARELQRQFQESMSQEQDERAEAARIAEIQKTWAQVLADHIAQRWLRPPGLPPGLRCKVQIDLLPNGEVTSVRVVQSSGNPSFDNSVVNAVYKSSPLPLPTDPKAFSRSLAPTFTPESLTR